MSYYQYHVFFCLNRREDGANCCTDHGSQQMRDYAKARCKELGIHGMGQVRINTAGCLNRCAEGPVMVVYPQETWYTYIDRDDIDEIIDSHLRQGKVVERLKI